MLTNQHAIENPTKILQDIRECVADDLSAFEKLVKTELSSSVPLTQEITQHIFTTKGKQLRPLLVILSSRALSAGSTPENKHYELAAVIEFVHTATLLHDDVVDHSDLRRGKKTANAIWGNAASVLVGDFLYSRAFQILARHHEPRILSVLSNTTNDIAEGEVRQLMNRHDAHLSLDNYFQVITQKTAQLFSAATEIGALLENANEKNQKAMAEYGLCLGIIFQMIDDLLDYETSSDVTGKNIGDDLSEGKATFPLIYAMQNSNTEDANIIRHAIQQADVAMLPKIIVILRQTNAFSATREKAAEFANRALGALENIPDSRYRKALEELVVFALKREY